MHQEIHQTMAVAGTCLKTSHQDQKASIFSLSEFRIIVMKWLQSIVQGRHPTNPGYEADKEITPGNTPVCTHAKIIPDSNSNVEQL